MRSVVYTIVGVCVVAAITALNLYVLSGFFEPNEQPPLLLLILIGMVIFLGVLLIYSWVYRKSTGDSNS